MDNTIIKVQNLNKKFIKDEGETEVLRNINLEIKKGEFITIVGHSGCGKSTLLKIICGLVSYEEGNVEREKKEVEGPDKNCGMVFQNSRLLPWLKIKTNIGFGLRGLKKEEKNKLIQQHLELVGLSDFGDSYPKQLSGGMAQRAAIARGLINNPPILLLDEPFGALDALTKIQMQKEIRRIQEEEGTTMVMVTHDIEEAIVLGDRIVVMSARPGEIKDIIHIDSAGRKRNSDDFNGYKRKIYNYLFEDAIDDVDDIEYII